MAIPSENLVGLRNQQFGSDGAFVFLACHRLVKFSFGFLINLRIGEDFQAEQSHDAGSEQHTLDTDAGT